MSFEMTLAEKPGYLHAIVTGKNTLENVAAYMTQLRETCVARGIDRVLIEERLTGRRLETWDVYQAASQGSARASGRFNAIAYVDVHASGELMKFAETVAVNRGMPIRVFASVEEAEAWIRTKAG